MTVKLIRMWSGEDVVADIVEETTDSIVITDPIVAVPSPQQGNIAFAPWSPLLQKDKIEVTKKYLVYIGEPQEEIIDHNKLFSNDEYFFLRSNANCVHPDEGSDKFSQPHTDHVFHHYNLLIYLCGDGETIIEIYNFF